MNRRRKCPPFFEAASFIRYHHYKIEYKNREHEIVCPKYRISDGSYVTLIPWFLVPGRPYPITVYLFAIELYSRNPNLGQRGAAKATRKKFMLKTFSHSTLSRSFRFIEELKSLIADPKKRSSESKHSEAEKPLSAYAAKQQAKKRFPSCADTALRRSEMSKFLRILSGTSPLHFHVEFQNINTSALKLVKKWHEKSKRLLL